MAEEAKPQESSLLSKLETLLTGLGKPASEADESTPGKAVPYERFHAVNERRRLAEEGLTTIRADIAARETAHKAALDGAKKELADTATAMELRRQEDVKFARSGLDDIGIETIRNAWRREPEATRGKTAADWWTGIITQHTEHGADEKKPAPQIHPTVAVLLPKVEKKQEQRQETQRRGLPARGESGGAKEPVLGQGRIAYLKSIGRG